MNAQITSIKRLSNNLVLTLTAVSETVPHTKPDFPKQIYIGDFTYRPKIAQVVRFMDDKLIIESRGSSPKRQYARVSGHYLTYKEDFNSPIIEEQASS